MGMASNITPEEKVRENRLRRKAERRGLKLVKSRRRDPGALDFNQWWVVDLRRDVVVFGGDYGETIDDVENYLLDLERSPEEWDDLAREELEHERRAIERGAEKRREEERRQRRFYGPFEGVAARLPRHERDS